MRLINTHTLEMESFSGPPPEFAILSHTWGTDDEEVTLQDMVTKPRAPDTLSKPGYIKIQKTCEVAREQFHHQYCWVDTACIDKTSSAELSEAINSMFKWYGNANICFAYLSDVEMGGANSEHPPDTRAELAKSRWFTRGWTLQELIAPGDMYFFDRNWHEIGMRSDLAGAIKFTTGIPAELLRWRPKNR